MDEVESYLSQIAEAVMGYASLLGFGEQGWGNQFLSGTLMTVMISLSGYLIGILAGLAGVAMKQSRHRPLRLVAHAYTTGVRAVPELLLILLIFYTGTTALNRLLSQIGLGDTVSINPFWAAAMTLGFVQGAYLTEVFRAARAVVPKALIEASDSLALGGFAKMRFIVFPLALRHAIPGMSNIWVVTLKESALISVVGLQELMMVGKTAAGYEKKYFFFFIVTAFVYFVLCKLSGILLGQVEKNLNSRFERSHRPSPKGAGA